jgi:2-oxoglutarate dehydrogenase E2 component (dihydrolipoamide succinyltransferase)
MPQLGETIIEGTILKWLKQEGEHIERDEPLFEISTDKVDTEVPSPVSGVVSKILVAEGATVPVKTDIAEIAEDGADFGAASGGGGASAAASSAGGTSAAASPAGGSPAVTLGVEVGSGAGEPAGVVAAPDASSVATPGAPLAGTLQDNGPRSQILSPLVRRLASEHGVDLAGLSGSGSGGRITKKDVLAAAASGEGGSVGRAGHPAAAVAAMPMAPVVAGAGEELVPITHIRRAIAQHMVASNQTAARAWTMVEVNVENLVRLRTRVKDTFFERHGVKLTYLPFLTRATVDALLAFPMVNAEFRGDDIMVRRYVNMGIAVSYDQGLIVPVIRGADGMNSVGIARAIADLAARARSHELQPEEATGATFTITNPGPYGSLLSVPIINQPNSGILSIDGIQKRPVVVEEDAIAVRHMVYISMSWDHRVIDGEVATRFLARVKQDLETWDFSEDLGL